MEKVMVTGASGFIGDHLTERLSEDGMVVMYDKLFSYNQDLTSYEKTRDFIRMWKPHTIIDCATLPLAYSLVKPYYVAYKIYCMATNLCELLREGYYKRLIHISSSEVYGTAKYIPMNENHSLNPRTPYAAAKAAQDMLIQSYIHSFGVNATIVRPFNTYGPGQDLNAVIPATIKRILSKLQPVITGDGWQSRDFLYVDDTVEGIVKTLENKKVKGKVINLASPNEQIDGGYTITEIVEMICRLMKYKGKIKYVGTRQGDVAEHKGDGTLASMLLDFEPKTILPEGIKLTIAWWRKQWRKKSFRQSHMLP